MDTLTVKQNCTKPETTRMLHYYASIQTARLLPPAPIVVYT